MGVDPEPTEPDNAAGSESDDAEATDLGLALKDALSGPAAGNEEKAQEEEDEEEEEEEEEEGEEEEEEQEPGPEAAAPVAVPAPVEQQQAGEKEASEPDDRSVEQEDFNERIRNLLRKRKRQGSAAEAVALPEDFISFAPSDAKAEPAPQSSGPPWLGPRQRPRNPLLRLHEELIDFVQFMRQTREELAARRKWVRTVGNACRALWPECQVRVFGSSSTGLCLPNGDVDIVALNVPCSPGVAMKCLVNRMLAARETSWLELVESAKVPVLKMRSRASGLRADVVFNEPNGLDTSAFLRERCQEFPQMLPLVLFLKYFLLQRGLHDTFTGGMGSWLLCNVVLHFLQRHPSRRDPKEYARISLGHLLFDFFWYYGEEFQYEWQGISVVDGGCIFDKAQRGWRGNRRGGGVHLCIEAPLGPPRDLGAPCFRMSLVRTLFVHGLRCLCHLFLSPEEVGPSLLCPLLLDAKHPVIAQRHALQAQQPVALPGVPCAVEPGEEGEKDEGGHDEAELDIFDDSVPRAPPAKRIKPLPVEERNSAKLGKALEAEAQAGAAVATTASAEAMVLEDTRVVGEPEQGDAEVAKGGAETGSEEDSDAPAG